MAAIMRTTVVLPFEPVTSTIGMSRTVRQSTRSVAGMSRNGQQCAPDPLPMQAVCSSKVTLMRRRWPSCQSATSGGQDSASAIARSSSIVVAAVSRTRPTIASSDVIQADSQTSVAVMS